MARQDILQLLTTLPGEYVSGEKISQQLNVTRASVWKQIKQLQEEGFEIEAQTKKGYCLRKTPDSLNAWVIEQMLGTVSFGRSLIIEDELPSTNAKAKELAREGGIHGQVIIARTQCSGRGRMQREWQSPKGGLWMSIIIRPNLSLANASKLTLAASVAVVDALKELYRLPVGIKWPNDLIYNGHKIAGILGEVVGEWNRVQTLILGIGINANFPRENLGSSIAAATLQEILGHEVDLNKLTAAILLHLEKQVSALEADMFEELCINWTARAVGIGEEVKVIRGEEVFRGIFRGISQEGELLLETDHGEVRFSAGEVRLRSKLGTYFGEPL
ncbi:birA, biotin-(acetyl-CoA-carboxylase) ligase [Desulfosporosinus acidiphilus SJ4]|uniref:Bifunctional ligase/repressor BirA n=1 Tax=Desulfosporosinus acidiphilus (strain DSM 22704 / JCM 16185 / SJ4) TaxID=646529 RepID=I4D079_DESAJ|nr:biotin--[acetyl-CoA-carboxylase] ligase [Desulfosporosinus acidiphilus]AFM39203.1 birA, biotin-(acetyl-CoA-carboxylase) ligase [Desulfosporosinus acidiphilus SJ4]